MAVSEAERKLIGDEPTLKAESETRLNLSEELTELKFDYNLEEQKKLLELKFNQQQQAAARATNLIALKGHVASSTNKIIKLFTHLHVSEIESTTLAQTVADQQKLLEAKGITGADFDYGQLAGTVESLNQDSITLKGQIAGLDFEDVRLMLPQFRTLQKNVGNFDVGKIDKIQREHQIRHNKLTAITDLSQAEVNSWMAATNMVHPLGAQVNNLLGLETRVQTLEANPTLDQNALEEVKENVEAVKRMLTEIQQLKEAIDNTPAAQNAVKSQFSSAKIPELNSLEPAEFKTWRERFLALAELQSWTDEHMKKTLPLAVPLSKIYVPLKLSTPNWDELTIHEILDKWEKRCCPDSYRDLANANLSQLHQGMEESSNAYIDRATELYIAAKFQDDNRDPEFDEQFILRLINSFRDARLRAPLRRRKPKTISELRVALNEESNIIASDPTTPAGNLVAVQAINSSALDSTSGGRNVKSAQKGQQKRCHVCKELHLAENCPVVKGFISAYEKNKQGSQSQQQGNQNDRGRGGGRGRGRGRGGGRGGRGRGGFRRPNEQPQGQDEGHPPQKMQKFDNQKN